MGSYGKQPEGHKEEPRRGGIGGQHSIGMPVAKAKNFKDTFKRVLKYLGVQRIKIVIVIITAILSTAFSIISPKIMGKATTKLFEGIMMKHNQILDAKIDFDFILQILVQLVVLYLLSSLFGYIQQYIAAEIAQKTVFRMRNDVSDKLSRLPLKFFDSKTHGEILSRVTNDIDNISNNLQQGLIQMMISATTILGILIMMLSISPILTIVALVTLPLSFIFAAIIAKRSQGYFVEQQKALGELNGHVEEMFTGHKIVKAFGYEKKSVHTFEKLNEKLYHFGWRAQFVSGIIMPIISFISNLGYVFVCIMGGMFVIKRTIEIGDIQAFIQYSRQFMWPITQVANIANIIQSTVASAERVFELLDEHEETVEWNNMQKIFKPMGNIEFRGVSFGYDENNILIKNMNLEVKSGQKIAIVGPTGAGKTTLVNLLMRFYDINDGKIIIDGVEIKELHRIDLRNLFGMVLQDTWLFNGSLRENIAYGRENATEEEIIRAAKTAQAHHFIRTLPEGYDTMLNEEASNISQGQKQLLTIARAFLKNPAILILDEATSSVDTRTETYIQKAMQELMKGRTSFVIAHRLSTIRDADLILVMNHGDIIEKGTHAELLAEKGFYAELYNSQFVA